MNSQGDAEYTEEAQRKLNELSLAVIGAAISVHRALGPGLLESAYQQCLGHELSIQKIPFESEVKIPINYKGLYVDGAYRLDFLVAGKLVLEIKSVEHVESIHKAQLLSYLRMGHFPLGLLINFNSPKVVDGIRRLTLTKESRIPSQVGN